MFTFIIFSTLLVSVFSYASPQVEVQPFCLSDELNYRKIYTWGQREPGNSIIFSLIFFTVWTPFINHLGDQLINSTKRGDSAEVPSQITTRYTYPKLNSVFYPGQITYLEVVADQRSNNSTAFVSQGGIGDNYIGVDIVAYDSRYLNTFISIYGKPYRYQWFDTNFCFSKIYWSYTFNYFL